MLRLSSPTSDNVKRTALKEVQQQNYLKHQDEVEKKKTQDHEAKRKELFSV